MLSRIARSARMLAAIVLMVAAVGCGGELAPRRAAVGGEADVAPRIFESARDTIALELTPEVGRLALRGLVSGTEPVDVTAPEAGLVFDVLVESGDLVAEGQPVLSFLPAATRADELELAILELQLELAVETGDTSTERSTLAALVELERVWMERAVSVEAPADGRITGLRSGLELSVAAERTLFTVSDPDALGVTVRTRAEVIEGVGVGDVVDVRSLDDAGSVAPGRVGRIDAAGEWVSLLVTFEDPSVALGIGDSAMVEFATPPADPERGRVWVPDAAVRRSEGQSHVLAERPDGGLLRIEARILARTTDFVLIEDPLLRLTPGTVVVVR